jgi:hypothetical protein
MPAQKKELLVVIFWYGIRRDIHFVVSIVCIPVVAELDEGVAECEPSVERGVFDVWGTGYGYGSEYERFE